MSALQSWLSHGLAGLFSLALHGFVFYLVFVGWGSEPPQRELPRPTYIQASLVQIDTRSKQAEDDARRAAAAKQRQVKQEKQRREQARRDKAAREKARQEKARKEQAQRDKAEQERARQDKAREIKAREEQARREAERRAEAEQARLLAEQQNREQALADALGAEDAFLTQQAAEELALSYVAYIQQRLVSNWNRPPSARLGMQVVLEIDLVPTGQVVSVAIVRPSGNAAFDRSAEQAVQKVGRFDKLQELARDYPTVFERNFRRLRLVFKPEDLRL